MSTILSGNSVITGNSTIETKLIFDDVSNVYWCLCPDKLISSYSGYSARVKRISDGEQKDFGYAIDSYGYFTLDRAGITAWAAGSNVYFTRFYNQGLYGGYWEQNTALDQPQYVINPETDLPCIYLNETFLAQAIPDITSVIVNNLHSFFAFVRKGYVGANDIHSSINDYGRIVAPAQGIDHYYSNTAGKRFIVKAAGPWGQDLAAESSAIAVDTPIVFSERRNNTDMIIRRNGIQTGIDPGLNAGPIQFPASTYYNIGESSFNHLGCNMHKFCDITCNAVLSDAIVNRIESYLMKRMGI